MSTQDSPDQLIGRGLKLFYWQNWSMGHCDSPDQLIGRGLKQHRNQYRKWMW